MTKQALVWGIRGLLGVGLISSFTGCVLGSPEDADEADVSFTQSALSNDGVYMGNVTGRLFTSAGGISNDQIQSNHIFNAMRDSEWPTTAPKRYGIIDWPTGRTTTKK